jgi:hypothetical protein
MKPKFIVSFLFYLTGISFVVLTFGTVFFMVSTIIINIHDKSKSGFAIEEMDTGDNISIYGIGSKVDFSYASDSTIRYYPKIDEYRVQVKANTHLAYYFFLFRLILLSVVITGSWFFLKILNEIKQGNPFNLRSIKYLKIIALVFITRDILEFINNLIFNQFIHASGIQSRFELPTTLTISNGILLGMSIWILAIIFQRGVELQTENDLTV